MREALEHDLQVITNDTLRMLDLVQDVLTQARRALLDRATDALEEARRVDREVDALEQHVEQDCLRVIALHQPVARDLRFIGMVLKSLTDIERMGDYAVHVAEDGEQLAQESPLKKYVNLGRMLERLTEMLASLRRALENRDVDVARTTLGMDDEVDDLFEQIQRELVTYMLEDPRTIGKALTLMRVGRSLERIGDHVENVAERIDYWVNGRPG